MYEYAIDINEGIHALLFGISELAFENESVAVAVVKMPFLDTLDGDELTRLNFFTKQSKSNPSGLDRLLADPGWIAEDYYIPIEVLNELYLESVYPEAIDAIEGLSWVSDGLSTAEHRVVMYLQELAVGSRKAFERLMDKSLSELPPGFAGAAIREIAAMSSLAEDALLQIIGMPFIDTVEQKDFEALQRLRELAENNPEGLTRVLSHSILSDGITDELSVYVSLLYLEQVNPELGAALNGLTWVQDGISYVPPQDQVRGNRLKENEISNVLYMVGFGVRAPELLRALVNKIWLQDGLGSVETDAIAAFHNLSGDDPELATELAKMPFLDTLDYYDMQTLWTLAYLQSETGVTPRQFLSNPRLASGISDENRSAVALLELSIRDPEDYAILETLPWIQDGLSAKEELGVTVLIETALATNGIIPTLSEKAWVMDGITRQESSAILGLGSLVYKPRREHDSESVLKIMAMPFLDTFEPADADAVQSLSALSRMEEGSYLRQVLDHPSFTEGITDEDTLIVTVLATVATYAPDKIWTLLDPNRVYLRERRVTLPLHGDIRLAVIRTEPGEFRTLDILEEIVFQYEVFMNQAYPSNVATILNLDIFRKRGGGGRDGIVTLHMGYEEDVELIAHEVAHTYWVYAPRWVQEGPVELMAKLVVNRLDEASTSPELTGCPYGSSLRELDQLVYEQSIGHEDLWWSSCMYTMGLGLYADLLNRLGYQEFQRGFKNLYLKMRDEVHFDECGGQERGLCYMRKAFVEEASPGIASVAGEVIDKWYYGTSQ